MNSTIASMAIIVVAAAAYAGASIAGCAGAPRRRSSTSKALVRETRRYVQNVLYFARIYAEHLGEPHPFLTEQEQ